MADKVQVGRVIHYFSKIGVAVVELSAAINAGDSISIEGPTTNVSQTIDSMQMEHKPVRSAGKGQSVGLKVPGVVREGDGVFKKK